MFRMSEVGKKHFSINISVPSQSGSNSQLCGQKTENLNFVFEIKYILQHSKTYK